MHLLKSCSMKTHKKVDLMNKEKGHVFFVCKQTYRSIVPQHRWMFHFFQSNLCGSAMLSIMKNANFTKSWPYSWNFPAVNAAWRQNFNPVLSCVSKPSNGVNSNNNFTLPPSLLPCSSDFGNMCLQQSKGIFIFHPSSIYRMYRF